MSGYMESSERTDWCTPANIVNAVKEMFDIIHLDPCSNEASIVGARVNYILPTNDGLKDTWNYPTIYVNPPFGSGLKTWVDLCAKANLLYGSEVILLLPAAVDTKWWQDIIFKYANGVCFLRGRVKFIGADSGAPMACALVYFGDDTERFKHIFIKLGTVLDIGIVAQLGEHRAGSARVEGSNPSGSTNI